MNIEWNKVTRNSISFTVFVSVGTFAVGFLLGTMHSESVYVDVVRVVTRPGSIHDQIEGTSSGLEVSGSQRAYMKKKFEERLSAELNSIVCKKSEECETVRIAPCMNEIQITKGKSETKYNIMQGDYSEAFGIYYEC